MISFKVFFPPLVLSVLIGLLSAPGMAADDDVNIYAQMKGAGVTGLAAAATVLKKYPGQLISYEADVEHGRLIYEFTVLQLKENQEVDVSIDAADGRILKAKKEEIDDDLPSDQKVLEGLVSFTQTYEKAEQDFGKYVVAMGLDNDHDHIYYELEIIEPVRASKILIDARTGKPISTFKRQ